jgi:hypothetical protein
MVHGVGNPMLTEINPTGLRKMECTFITIKYLLSYVCLPAFFMGFDFCFYFCAFVSVTTHNLQFKKALSENERQDGQRVGNSDCQVPQKAEFRRSLTNRTEEGRRARRRAAASSRGAQNYYLYFLKHVSRQAGLEVAILMASALSNRRSSDAAL